MNNFSARITFSYPVVIPVPGQAEFTCVEFETEDELGFQRIIAAEIESIASGEARRIDALRIVTYDDQDYSIFAKFIEVAELTLTDGGQFIIYVHEKRKHRFLKQFATSLSSSIGLAKIVSEQEDKRYTRFVCEFVCARAISPVFSDLSRKFSYGIAENTVIMNAVWLPVERIVFDSNSRVVFENYSRKKAEGAKFSRNNFLPTIGTRVCVRKTELKVCIAENAFSHNYFHWLCEAVPAALQMKEWLRGNDFKFVFTNIRRFHVPTLECVGLVGDTLLINSPSPIMFSACIFTPVKHPATSQAQSESDIDESNLSWVDPVVHQVGTTLREVILKEKEYDLTIPGRRIYASRLDSSLRRMCNEVELIEALETSGFEILVCSELSFDEQVRIFSEASVVVGPHGAALTNILFCRQDSVVVEILPPALSRQRAYENLSKAVKLMHSRYVVRSGSQSSRDAEYTLDIDDFIHHLSTLNVL